MRSAVLTGADAMADDRQPLPPKGPRFDDGRFNAAGTGRVLTPA